MSTCTTCKNNGNTRGECQNATCSYEAREPDYKAQRDALLEAHRKIVSDGDFSSPEGMKRIALAAIASVKGGE